MPPVGHWANLQEAEKLTQSRLISGLVTEYIRRGGVLTLTSPGIPVAQFNGLSVKWNRENDVPAASFVESIGAQLAWQSGQDFIQLEKALKSMYIQTYLDNYIPEIYTTVNDYRATQLLADSRAMIELIEDSMIYGHEATSPGNLEFDGFHTIASRYQENYDGESLDFDMEEAALSLATLRELEDVMRHGIDYLIMAKPLARRFDAYVQEAGIQNNASTLGTISFGTNELGRRITMWNDVPILRSDWMVGEKANTGTSASSRREKAGSGDTKMYSILAVKFGNVYETQPGLTLAWGNNGGSTGRLWKTVLFDKLEDYDAEGIRLISHMSVLDGSTMAIGRIRDIADARLVV